MKEVNGLPVYEKDDPCALHEYSKQMAEKVSEKMEEQKTNIETVEGRLSTLEKTIIPKQQLQERFNGIASEQEEQNKSIEEQNNAIKETKQSLINVTTEKSKSLHITDGSNLEGKINIFGNSEQEVRSGKNILDINSNEVYRTASTTVEINGNTINATSNNNPVTSYVSIPIEVKANTDYAFSGVAKVVSNTITDAVSVYAKVRDEKNGGSWISGGQATINKDSTANQDLNLTFNSGEHTTVWLWLYIKSSGVSGIISIDFSNLQVEEGTTKTDYEEYGVSPSPKFPSDIKNVGSNVNLLDFSVGETTVNGITAKDTKNGITLNGKCTADTWIMFNFSNVSLKKGRYTISCRAKLNEEDISSSEDRIAIKINSQDNMVMFNKNNTINISDGNIVNSGYIRLFSGDTFDNVLLQCKFEEGELATSYSPYNCGNIGVSKTNSNILQQFEETKESQVVNGITITKNNDGTYTLNGTSTGIVDLILFGSWASKEIKFRLNKGMIYFKANSSKINGYINIFSITANKSFTINANSSYDNQILEDISYMFIRLCIGAGVTFNNEKVVFELSYDNVSTLEVNKNEKIVFPLEEGQRLMLGDYLGEDEKIHHVRKQIELDGTENLQLRSKNDDGTYTYSLSTIIDYKHTQNMQAICSHFENLGTTNSVASMKTKGIGFSFYYNAGATTTSALYLNTTIETVEELIAWLTEQKEAGTPVIVEYELAEEETEDFTENQKTAYKELQNAKTYKTITNITTEENMALIEAEYTADPKTYIDNKASEIKEQLNVINELLSTTKTSAKLLDNLKSDLESEVL